MKMLSTGMRVGVAASLAALAGLQAQAPPAPDVPPATPPGIPAVPRVIPEKELKTKELKTGADLPFTSGAAASDPLAALEAAYAENRAAALRRVLARYADELETLGQTLAANGDTAGAARARMERDRVLPALGLPAVSAEDAGDFAAFEDGPDPVAPAPPATPPGDLDSILKSLQSGPQSAAADTAKSGPAAASTPAGSASGGSAKGARRLLRMTNAELIGEYDALYGHYSWFMGSKARWTLNDLPPGTYQLLLRYTCDEKDGGGRIAAEFGTGKVEADIVPTGGWKRRKEIVLGPFEVTGNRAEVLLKVASIKKGALYLMDLSALLVQPVAPGKNPDKP
ncbi:MAG: hypothetical protein JWL81_2425 [Verrucomicrobiales bacterium]|nr:hypothetical protein [Verrucomicrobiales bacterium]